MMLRVALHTAILTAHSTASASPACELRPVRLRTNNLDAPALGVPVHRPRLSWGFEATTSPPERGLMQTAYRIQATSQADSEAIVWDSGKVASGESLEIAFGGSENPLKPSQTVHWRVTVWYEHGPAEGCPSAPSVFETALAGGEAGWTGTEWLARYPPAPLNATGCDLYDDQTERTQAPRFRSEIAVPPAVVSARAYIVGLGYYQLYIDGKRIGTSQLDPGWTTYSKTVLYAVYDVTEELKTQVSTAAAGKHAVGVELGNGWWNPMTLKMWGHTDVRGALTVGQGRGNGTTTEPMFRLKLLATMSDGTQKTLLSSSVADDWRAAGSPTTFNNIYLGEHYDARKEAVPGNPLAWSTVGYDASTWTKAVPAAEDPAALNLGTLEPQSVPPIRRQGVLPTTVVAKAIPTAPGSHNSTIILDTGKNHAGVCRFRLQGSEKNAGQKVVMRYGELLNADGVSLNPMTSVAGQIKGPTENVCIENPGRSVATGQHVAFQADEMTLSGRAAGPDDWIPSYSWHGFRYIEVTVPHGMKVGPEEPGAVECYPMRTDVDIVANFSSSDPFLDQLRTLNRNTFDSNLMSVQSDCPHRERFGYGGDPLGCGEAGLSIYDWSTFYAKRVRDFNDAQTVDPTTGQPAAFPETAPFVGIRCGGCGADGGFSGDVPDFPGAGGPIGWQTYQPVTQLWLYKYYGDLQTMRESFNQTYAYVQMLEAAGSDPESKSIEGGLGDWMPVQSTTVSYTGPGFERMSFLAFANITELLGKPELTATYRSKAASVAEAINAKFLNESSGAYAVSTSFPENHGNHTRVSDMAAHKASQAGQGMALFEGIVPEDLKKDALKIMVANAQASEWILQRPSPNYPKSNKTTGGPGAHMTAGLFGIKWFLMALADGNENDVAYEVLTTPSYPSFKWMMNNEIDNATTIWESWSFSDGTFSHNHPMFASSEVWLIQSLGGIQPHPSAKGFNKVLIKPSPPSQLQHATTSFETVRGVIKTAWSKSGSTYILNVTVPPNVVATVHVPCKQVSAAAAALALTPLVTESGRALEGGRREDNSVVFEVGSGEYHFESEY